MTSWLNIAEVKMLKLFCEKNFVLFVLTLSCCKFFMALGINQVTYSDRKFCQSVCLSVPVLLL